MLTYFWIQLHINDIVVIKFHFWESIYIYNYIVIINSIKKLPNLELCFLYAHLIVFVLKRIRYLLFMCKITDILIY